MILFIHSLNELTDPLISAWMNNQLDMDIRATILSINAQAGALGQVSGRVLIGLLAQMFTAPLALMACAGLLLPALIFIRRANLFIRPAGRNTNSIL